jgi:hypothetical protein
VHAPHAGLRGLPLPPQGWPTVCCQLACFCDTGHDAGGTSACCMLCEAAMVADLHWVQLV